MGDTTLLLVHKYFIDKHLLQGFPTNPRVISTLKLSLIKLSKSIDLKIVSPSVKDVYNKITLFLGDLGFTYCVNKKIRDSSTRDLH